MSAGRPGGSAQPSSYAYSVTTAQAQGGRDEQEDSFVTEVVRGTLLAAIADGMGGHAGGKEASQLAVRTALQGFIQGHKAVRLMQNANEALTALQRHIGGTTLTLLTADAAGCVEWAHVGDTRLWHIPASPNRAPMVVSHDMHIPKARNQLMGFLPARPGDSIPPEAGQFHVAPGDLLVLTTDGVHDTYAKDHDDVELPQRWPDEWWKIPKLAPGLGLVDHPDAAEVLRRGLALHRHKEEGWDNATVIVIQVLGEAT